MQLIRVHGAKARGALKAVMRRKPWLLPFWLLTGRANWGHCSICNSWTIFSKYNPWLRDHYRCVRCWSIPRERALVKTLQDMFPRLSELRVHESSPGTVSSKWLAQNSGEYVGTHYFADVPPGSFKGKIRCENLERMTFEDGEFDVMITQDVMEHVLDPAHAFSEIARILRPDGVHVYTVPIYPRDVTITRARYNCSGAVEFLLPPEYHGNPIDKGGSLVATEWGDDLPDFIYHHSGMATDRISFNDSQYGLIAEFLDVLVSRKSE